MKTTIKGIDVKKALELAKPFVGSLRKKVDSRPILKTALITENYVIATDSHTLIRIKHNEEVTENRLHHYKSETNGHGPESYPNISRLVPNPYDAQKEVKINVSEWLEAHTLALISAKEHKNRTTTLENNKISVQAVEEIVNKDGKKEKNPLFNQVSFTYTLDNDTEIEKVSYNCEYMLLALKTFKKLKCKEVTMYYYGSMRPMYFVSELAEALLLPIRSF
jgi:hypothetical protein